MKYFRTKDGRIIEFDDRICNSLPHAIDEPIDDNVGFYKGVEVIAQADAIDELIDGLIVEEKGNPNNWFIMEVYDFKNEEEHSKNWTYHAFIKTDKGLIYVAEMNGEGKLKLL